MTAGRTRRQVLNRLRSAVASIAIVSLVAGAISGFALFLWRLLMPAADAAPSTTPELKWSDNHDPSWSTTVAASVGWQEILLRRGLPGPLGGPLKLSVKEMACPRCGHGMWVEEYGGGTGLLLVVCNCIENHEGGPEGAVGCGMACWIPRRDGLGAVSPAWPSFPVSSDDRQWQKDAEERRHKGLDDVRGRAKRWLETVGTLLGVFAVVTFIKGPEGFSDLATMPVNFAFIHTDSEHAALAFLILAAATAALSVVSFALAETGWPALQPTMEAWSQRTHNLGAFRTSVLWFHTGRISVLFAATFVFFGLWITALSAVDAPSKAKATHAIVMTADGPRCGELLAAADGRLELNVGASSPLPLALGSTVDVLEACPTPSAAASPEATR